MNGKDVNGGIVLKIIHIMDELAWGGVNSFVRDLCQELYELNNEVYVIIIMNPHNDFESYVNRLDYNNIHIESLNSKNKIMSVLRYIKPLRNRIKQIANGEKTICNVHLRLSSLMGACACWGLNNVKVVETYHSAYKFYKLQTKLLSSLIDMYVPCSDSAGKEMEKRFKISRKKMFVISNGVNRDRLRKNVSHEMNKSDEVIALSVGRLTKQKNFHISVEAFLPLGCRTFKYILVGDGELFEDIEKLVKNNDYVQLKGSLSREEVLKELGNCDVVIMPSLWEGLSIFMLESLAFDNPMIISETESLINVFGERKLKNNELFRCCSWGYICQTDNVESYRAAMQHFIAHREKWGEMRSAIKDYSMEYDIKNVAKKYLSMYVGLMNN